MKMIENNETVGSGGFWNGLRNQVQRFRSGAAETLGGWFNGYTPGGQKIVLLGFVVLCATASAIVLARSFFHPYEPTVHVDSIRQPYISPKAHTEPVLAQREYERLHSYRLHLDSLIAGGDTLQRGLRDTLLYLEVLYHQQLKNKRHEQPKSSR
ncbi:hypothetical protein [Flaviaesturariibacter amylovorans]|uniref:DUF4129 domain-containing protein n=1 Tax=Flaviaesturariibacter amylovorans TaxID=1084520 RepID=A0ABP8HHZ8_9BACT